MADPIKKLRPFFIEFSATEILPALFQREEQSHAGEKEENINADTPEKVGDPRCQLIKQAVAPQLRDSGTKMKQYDTESGKTK